MNPAKSCSLGCIGPDVFYTTSSALYEIPEAGVTRNGISVQWAISGTAGTDYVVTGGLTNRQLNIRFLTLGNRTVTAILTLPNSGGQTYSVVKNVRVVTSSTITGQTSPRIGLRYSYTLNNGSSSIVWRVFRKENGTLTRVDENSYSPYYPYSSSSTSFGVMFLQSGTYVIKAQDASTSRMFDVAELEVTVPYEQSSISYYPLIDVWNGFSIDGVKKYKKQYSYPLVVYSFPPPPGSEFVELPVNNNFYCWYQKPSSTHPHFNLLVPVYYRWHLASFSNYSTANNGGAATSNDIDFYLFNTQLAGTVPIYRVQEGQWIDRVEKWGNYYLTAVNVVSQKIVTKRRLGKDRNWRATTNLGMVGYAYPHLN